MAQAEDLTGKEFGFLQVISRAPDRTTPSGQKRKYWLCECTLCNTQKEISAQNLKRGLTKSCGCYQAIRGKAARNVKICVECGASCPAILWKSIDLFQIASITVKTYFRYG